MRLSPNDLRRQTFGTSFRGHDPAEVAAFLEKAAQELEAMAIRQSQLEEELRRREERLQAAGAREQQLHDALLSAQKLAEEMKAQARKDADRVLVEAEAQAEKIVGNAHLRLVQVVDDINELKRQRIAFETSLRALLETHSRLLETTRSEPPAPRVGENVAFLTQKPRAAGEG